MADRDRRGEAAKEPSADRRANPTADPLAHPDEPGAYVGRQPERQAETIPGGVRPDDERIAAHSTQVGDRDAEDVGDEAVRKGGQER